MIPEEYLDEGTLFLAQVPNGPLSSCAYGLRLRVSLTLVIPSDKKNNVD